MIDYLSLALGHGLLAIALLRLVMREELDVDPQIKMYADKAEAEREAASVAGRNARRRQQNRSILDGKADQDDHAQHGSRD